MLAKVLYALTILTLLAGSAFSQDSRNEREENRRRRSVEEAKLRNAVLDANFEDVDFVDAVSFISSGAGVNMIIHPKVLDTMEGEPITLKTSQLSAWNTLNLMLQVYDLKLSFRHGVYVITTPDDYTEDTYFVVYDIRDITFPIHDFPGPEITIQPPSGRGGGMGSPFFEQPQNEEEDTYTAEEIIDIIENATGSEMWDNSNTSINTMGGQLIVTQTEEGHAKVAEIIGMLRANR
ncbi:MAG: hypothetical protein NUW37_00730 [Planctomycetes bacterium]|nr:hypothetical protein [Planctomycetota bacterium]